MRRLGRPRIPRDGESRAGPDEEGSYHPRKVLWTRHRERQSSCSGDQRCSAQIISTETETGNSRQLLVLDVRQLPHNKLSVLDLVDRRCRSRPVLVVERKDDIAGASQSTTKLRVDVFPASETVAKDEQRPGPGGSRSGEERSGRVKLRNGGGGTNEVKDRGCQIRRSTAEMSNALMDEVGSLGEGDEERAR